MTELVFIYVGWLYCVNFVIWMVDCTTTPDDEPV